MRISVRGYFVTDKNMQRDGYQFELNKEFTSGEAGFQFCENLIDCFSESSDRENRVFEVVALNVTEDHDNASICSAMFFERELTWFEVLTRVNTGKNNTGMSNSGNHNSGHHNTGHHNSGNYNSGSHNSGRHNIGDRNTGNYNSGSDNSGHYNSGSNNSGHYNSGHHNNGNFNTVTPDTILVFNKPVYIGIYYNYKKPDFLFFDLHEYDENFHIVKVLGYKEAFIKSWENADPVDRMRIKDCPNFDYDIFYEISGIDVRKYE